MTSTDTLTDFERQIAQFIVTTLNLDVAAGEIAPLEPLYGDGLGLDSIDVLEVALAVSKQYGFQMRSDDANNAVIFSSLRNLAAHIAAHRT
jgi:acyl carrier protein